MSPSPSQSPLTDKGAVVPSAANTIKVWPIGHTKVPGGDGIAAGVCGPTPGPTVIGFMDPDTAYPRCFVIGPSQQLELVNSTDRFGGPGQSLTVRWADYPTVTIKPGHAVIYVGEFSSYLGGGEHHPVASPLDTTPELYLRDATHTLAGSP